MSLQKNIEEVTIYPKDIVDMAGLSYNLLPPTDQYFEDHIPFVETYLNKYKKELKTNAHPETTKLLQHIWQQTKNQNKVVGAALALTEAHLVDMKYLDKASHIQKTFNQVALDYEYRKKAQNPKETLIDTQKEIDALPDNSFVKRLLLQRTQKSSTQEQGASII
jgi:hypothetical protein